MALVEFSSAYPVISNYRVKNAQVAAILLTSCNRLVKAGIHKATSRCNTLLQQIALFVQSNDKSYALIAAIGSNDKSPGVNASTFSGRLIKFHSLLTTILLRVVNSRFAS